ncbi:hypothetical protein Q5P01_025543 [Channa striata]|uniref:Uncharacterized protein n=1 Tax=Channa striata TaxID=64152 RepID=A0AA88LPP7_CHASR|nr:hypothetical protein Q5P01_025543 [Channa striata]
MKRARGREEREVDGDGVNGGGVKQCVHRHVQNRVHTPVRTSVEAADEALLEGGYDDWQADDSVSHPTASPLDDVTVLPSALLMQQIQSNQSRERGRVKGSATFYDEVRWKTRSRAAAREALGVDPGMALGGGAAGAQRRGWKQSTLEQATAEVEADTDFGTTEAPGEVKHPRDRLDLSCGTEYLGLSITGWTKSNS